MKYLVPAFFAVAIATSAAQEKTKTWHERMVPTSNFDPPDRAIGRDPGVSFQVLLMTDTFAGVAVGYGGERSRQVRSFNRLLDEPDATAVFSDLLRRATPAGKLYALCGLYIKDLDKYRVSHQQMMKSESIVKTQFGCMVSTMPVRAILKSNRANVVKLKKGETIEKWHMRNPKLKDYTLDIAGGGYPTRFANSKQKRAKATEKQDEL